MSPQSLFTRRAQPVSAPALRILVYVDAEAFMPGGAYSTACLEAALKTGPLAVDVEVQSRTRGVRITPELLAPFHEAWFFLKAVGGAPLAPEEVAALLAWMDRGNGVLVAGDHALENRDGTYEGLGVAVGGNIPRARHLRAWNEPPGTEPKTMADTTEFTGKGRKLDPYQLEEDATPQRLLLPVVDGDEPHPLFRDAAGLYLDRFPDHVHEGVVKGTVGGATPALAGEWPDGGPAPVIVARGIDWRHGRVFDLMAVWDGHAAPLEPRGRIVADSSFHHYVDDNLRQLVDADADEWRKIRTLYRNLAAWLAPPALKRAHREQALACVARHDGVVDIADTRAAHLGAAASPLLGELLPAVWLHEAIDDLAVEHGVAGLTPEVRAELAPYVLGECVRDRVHREDPPAPAQPGQPAALAASPSVLTRALDDYGAALRHKQSELSRVLSAIRR